MHKGFFMIHMCSLSDSNVMAFIDLSASFHSPPTKLLILFFSTATSFMFTESQSVRFKHYSSVSHSQQNEGLPVAMVILPYCILYSVRKLFVIVLKKKKNYIYVLYVSNALFFLEFLIKYMDYFVKK